MFIEKVRCRKIKNSRKEDSVEVKIESGKNIFVSSSPSGKSKGIHEVADYNERGIDWSIKLANKFLGFMKNKNITIKNFEELSRFEEKIKSFERDYGILGGNVVYAIESVILKASAKDAKKPLWKFIYDLMNFKSIKMPMPIGNCIGGGLHSKGIGKKRPDFQEFELIAQEKSFSKAVEKNIYAYLYAKKLFSKLQKKKVKINDENAIETGTTNDETLKILSDIAEKYNLRIGIDVASSSFINKMGYYHYKNKELIRDRLEQIDYMRIISGKYNLLFLEDPLSEDDFSGFKELLSQIKIRKLDTLVVGDDLTTTNLRRLERAIKSKAINAIIIKPNQIGSMVEVKKVVELCKKNNIKTIFSHRSGETMDDALGDFAVGFQADFIKTGIYGPERLIKLRRIMQIEKSIK